MNLTCMLVLTTIFIDVSNNLPKTSYMKMIDVWLLFTLLQPFIVVLIHTYMDTLREEEAENKLEGQNNKKQICEEVCNLYKSSLCSDWPERNYFCEIQNRIQFVFSLAGEKILL